MPYLGNGLSKFTTADDLTVSGDATIDTTTLVVDSTNNRVGVLNASPTTALDVTGTVTADGIDVQGDGTISGGSRLTISDIADENNDGIRLDDSTTSRFNNLTQDSSGNFKIQHWTGSAWQNNLTLTTGGKLVQGGTTHDFSGNFGIQIDASGSDNANIIFRTASDSETFIVGADQALDAGVLNVLSNDPMVFKTNDTERVRIDNSGRVSIHPDGTPFFGESSADNLNIYQTGANVGMTLRSDDNRAIGIYFADGASGAALYQGYIQYNHANQLFDFAGQGSVRLIAGGNERVRVLSSGGITFNGDTATANALDDYEEGTWTASVVGSSGGNAQSMSGYYTKVGNKVYVHASAVSGLNLSSSSGVLVINGLPFTAKSGAYQGFHLAHNNAGTNATGRPQIIGYVVGNTQIVALVVGSGVGWNDFTVGSNTSAGIIVSGTYEVA